MSLSVLISLSHTRPPSPPLSQFPADAPHRGIARAGFRKNQRASTGWHADITFEPVPSDYAILKMHTLPSIGGDTLWASGYEAYDRLSPAIQKLADGLTATHFQPNYVRVKDQFGEELIDDYRGAPENTGLDFKAEQ